MKKVYNQNNLGYQTFNELGQYHSYNDEPAIETTEGYFKGEKLWFKNGKCHRDTGPAVIFSNGKKEYDTNGKYVIPWFVRRLFFRQKKIVIKDLWEKQK